MGANDGHIIVKGGKAEDAAKRVNKKDIVRFFRPVDKGSSRPAFCLPTQIERYQEDVSKMERAVELGQIQPERKMAFEQKLKQKKERLDLLLDSKDNAKKIINEDPDYWAGRRTELAEEIKAATPSRKDIKRRHVNPHKVIRMEKDGLERKKQEYIIISRAMRTAGHDVDSDVSFLERE